MGQVIYADRRDENEPDLKLLYHLEEDGSWNETDIKPDNLINLIYLGHDDEWGDMFSGVNKVGKTTIEILRGELNSGKW